MIRGWRFNNNNNSALDMQLVSQAESTAGPHAIDATNNINNNNNININNNNINNNNNNNNVSNDAAAAANFAPRWTAEETAALVTIRSSMPVPYNDHKHRIMSLDFLCGELSRYAIDITILAHHYK
jgi:hypothetical protein